MAEESKILVKFLTGAKNKIQEKIDDGTIDEGDIVLTSDTDEVVFINPAKEIKPMVSRTKEEHVATRSVGGINKNDTIAKGIDLDAFIQQILTGEEATEKKIQLVRSETAARPGTYPYGENLTLNVSAIADIAGDIKIYEAIDNADPVVIAQQTNSTLVNATGTLNASGTANYIELYATIDDNIESNALAYEFAKPFVVYDSNVNKLTDDEIVSEILNGDPYMELEDFGDKSFLVEAEQYDNCVWYAVRSDIGMNSIDGIFTGDGDNIANYFSATEKTVGTWGDYIICKYIPKIPLPAATNIYMRIKKESE